MSLCRYNTSKPCENHGTSSRTCLDCVLDKIRAEIDQQEKWLQQAGYNAYNVDIAFDAIRRLLNVGEGEFSDYPDIPYQFDNMTGSMNL